MSQTVTCPKCGTANSASAAFCSNPACGHMLVPMRQTQQVPTTTSTLTTQQGSKGATALKKRPFYHQWWVWLIAGAVVLLLAGGIYAFKSNLIPFGGPITDMPSGGTGSAVQHSVVGTWVMSAEDFGIENTAAVITFYSDGTTSEYSVSSGGVKSDESKYFDWGMGSFHDRETLIRGDPSFQTDLATSYVTFSQNSFSLEDVELGNGVNGSYLPAGHYYKEGTPQANQILDKLRN